MLLSMSILSIGIKLDPTDAFRFASKRNERMTAGPADRSIQACAVAALDSEPRTGSVLLLSQKYHEIVIDCHTK